MFSCTTCKSLQEMPPCAASYGASSPVRAIPHAITVKDKSMSIKLLECCACLMQSGMKRLWPITRYQALPHRQALVEDFLYRYSLAKFWRMPT